MTNESRISEDIAVIKNELVNIKTAVTRIEKNQEVYCAKVDALENKQIVSDTKMSNMNIFQLTISVIASAIAAYLGTRRP
jgi:hypothetical protein